MVCNEINYGSWRDAFAATPTSIGLRMVLWWATLHHWATCVGDIVAAFLFAHLPKDWRVAIIPPNTELEPEGLSGEVWWCHRALYGMREAPQLWQECFAKGVSEIGWIRLISDPQVFTHRSGRALMCIHVDDLVLTAPEDELQMRYDEIGAVFEAKPKDLITPDTWVRYLCLLYTSPSPRD